MQYEKRSFEIDTVCPRCKTALRLIAMIGTEVRIDLTVEVGSARKSRYGRWRSRRPSRARGNGWGTESRPPGPPCADGRALGRITHRASAVQFVRLCERMDDLELWIGPLSAILPSSNRIRLSMSDEEHSGIIP